MVTYISQIPARLEGSFMRRVEKAGVASISFRFSFEHSSSCFWFINVLSKLRMSSFMEYVIDDEFLNGSEILDTCLSRPKGHVDTDLLFTK